MSGLLVRQVWPLALMLCAERVPIVSPHSKCDDPNGFSRSPERPYLHYVVMPSPIGGADRSAPTYAASNSVGSRYLSPRAMIAHAIRDLVGQGNGSHLGRPARHQPPQPRVFLRPEISSSRREPARTYQNSSVSRVAASAHTISKRRYERVESSGVLPVSLV